MRDPAAAISLLERLSHRRAVSSFSSSTRATCSTATRSARLDAHISEQTDLIYTDEDSIFESVRSEPFYKPDWSPERLLNQHYLGRVCAFRRTLVQELGALRPEANTAWEYDLAFARQASTHAGSTTCQRPSITAREEARRTL